MRIRKPRAFTFPGVLLATVLGVLGGVYIWKPLIEEYYTENHAAEVVDDLFLFKLLLIELTYLKGKST